MSKLKRQNSRSQMKIMEMSFMLVAVAIFFVFVLLFWITISGSQLKQTVYEGKRSGNILLISGLAGSPEFSCVGTDSLCVDTDKIVALKESKAYSKFWAVDGLVIQTIYPNMNKTVECNLGNYPQCNTFTIIKPPQTGFIEDASFVSLCRKNLKNGYFYDDCTLGKISAYTKTE